jgi:hypothetical protein
MIQDLLWRCPLCTSNDALRHRSRFLQPDQVTCTICGAQWRVRRVLGDNYYLKITHPGANGSAYPSGFELSITGWYDLMKQTVQLEALPEPPDLLEPGENLYLASGLATLWVEAEPEIRPDPGADLPVHSAADALVGTGSLYLTNRRILWHQPARAAEQPEDCPEYQTFTYPLGQVNGIHTILNLGLFLVVGTQLFTLRFASESPLKWVTYMTLLAPRVRAECGHRIRTSHF